MKAYEYELAAMRKKWVANGQPQDSEFRVRRTGRTTGECLSIIGLAMRRPGTPVRISNHNVYGCPPNMEMEQLACRRIMELLHMMELEFFTVDKYELTVTYNVPEVKL